MNQQHISIATTAAAADLTAAIVMRAAGSSITGTKEGQYITQGIVAKVAVVHVKDEVLRCGLNGA